MTEDRYYAIDLSVNDPKTCSFCNLSKDEDNLLCYNRQSKDHMGKVMARLTDCPHFTPLPNHARKYRGLE